MYRYIESSLDTLRPLWPFSGPEKPAQVLPNRDKSVIFTFQDAPEAYAELVLAITLNFRPPWALSADALSSWRAGTESPVVRPPTSL